MNVCRLSESSMYGMYDRVTQMVYLHTLPDGLVNYLLYCLSTEDTNQTCVYFVALASILKLLLVVSTFFLVNYLGNSALQFASKCACETLVHRCLVKGFCAISLVYVCL